MSNEGYEPGKVKVKNNAYKFEGAFHHIERNQPILNEKGDLVGVTNPRNMTYVHTYGGEAVFFENLSKGKIIASRCDNKDCTAFGSIFMPFRIHCPDCLSRNTHVDITDIAKTTSRVHTFMITERTGAFNTLPKPIKFVNVEFEGVVTILMGPMLFGRPEIGMKVVPIFRTKDPTYTILDLGWVPKGTKESDLPEFYTFDA
ncbi:MAG: hypothetical protein JXA22_07230 [Candidatus Thermoplasmatota archaeon]|nr:hypothetical protein [Candidatus Thermoplasmatota archaeon]